MGNEHWLDLDLLKQENISPHISDMIFVTSYIPKYANKNEFDYLLKNNFSNGQFIFDKKSNFEGVTRSFNFTSSNSNTSPKIIRFSNRKIYNTN